RALHGAPALLPQSAGGHHALAPRDGDAGLRPDLWLSLRLGAVGAAPAAGAAVRTSRGVSRAWVRLCGARGVHLLVHLLDAPDRRAAVPAARRRAHPVEGDERDHA